MLGIFRGADARSPVKFGADANPFADANPGPDANAHGPDANPPGPEKASDSTLASGSVCTGGPAPDDATRRRERRCMLGSFLGCDDFASTVCARLGAPGDVRGSERVSDRMDASGSAGLSDGKVELLRRGTASAWADAARPARPLRGRGDG